MVLKRPFHWMEPVVQRLVTPSDQNPFDTRRDQMAVQISPEAPRYAISPDFEHELRRLKLLEQAIDPFTISGLETVGVAPGARCLELGGGAGSIARWLSRQVGPGGHVTATDLDTRWLERVGDTNVTVLRHNLLEDDFPDGSFDLIHARAVLEHIADREHALDRIVRWLAPGGWLVLEDAAAFTLDSSIHSPYAHAMRSIARTLECTGSDFEWARTLPEPLTRHGLERVGAHTYVPMIRGGTPLAEFWSLSIQSIGPRAADLGIATQAELDAGRLLLADPSFFDLSIALIGTWGRRP
jgi:SAM-dependent methyltransferase